MILSNDLSIFSKQRDCIQFALTAKPAQRYMPDDHKSLQYKIWTLVMSKKFDAVIMVLIALNTAVLMSQVTRMSKLSVNAFYCYMAVSYRVWEQPNSRI